MKPTFTIVLSLTAISLLFFTHVQAAEKITTAGSSTVRPIVDKAGIAFKKTRPDVSFVVGGGGSSLGIKAVGSGEVMIGQASRLIKDEEMKTYQDLVPFTIGFDGIALIVNGKNPVKKITKQQVQDIYTGKITNWSDIDGGNAPISFVSKEEGHGTLEMFLKYFDLESTHAGEGKDAAMVFKVKGTDTFGTAQASLIGANKDAIGFVSTKPYSIAYVSIGIAQKIAQKGGRLHLLELDGVAATVENVGNKTYPLRRPLHLITKGEPRGTVKEFIDFMMSDEGQQIAESLEFIRVN